MANSSNQFVAFWHALGVNQKVTIVLSVLGVLALMVGLLVWSSQPRMELLYSRISEKDASRITEMLDSQNIPYRLEGDRIFVPARKRDQVRMRVASEELISGNSVGFEIFDEGNFGVSDFVQRTNKSRALMGELERSIMTIDAIESARVILHEQEDKLVLRQHQDPAKASVSVETGGSELSNKQIIGIRNMVAFAIGGLKPENVNITDNRGISLSQRVSNDGQMAQANSQLKLRSEIEKNLNQKIRRLLAPVLGDDNISVEIGVDIATERVDETKDMFDPDSQVARVEEVEKESSESTEVQQDPVVGETPNTPQGLAGNQGGQPDRSESTSDRQRKRLNYEISRITTNTVRQPGEVKEITASVIVNEEVTTEAPVEGESGNAAGNADGNSISAEQIKQQVQDALGPLVSSVSVVQVPFRGKPGALPTKPGIQQQVKNWINTLQGPIVVGIAVLLFVFFLRMIKQHKPAITPIETLTGEEDEEALARTNVSPRPTPELLNELIQEKPENVAQALKSWSATK